MLDRLRGKASFVDNSSYGVERFYSEGEEAIRIFKFMRDEIVITNRGIYNIDAQGVTGKKVEYKFFPLKGLKYISIETAGSFDRDFDLKIGVDGNTNILSNGIISAPITVKVHKKDTESGFELYRIIKDLILEF